MRKNKVRFKIVDITIRDTLCFRDCNLVNVHYYRQLFVEVLIAKMLLVCIDVLMYERIDV